MREIWIDTKTAAKIMNVSDRTIQRNITKYKYKEEESKKGGNRGKVYKIALSSLPSERVKRYYGKRESGEIKTEEALFFLKEVEREKILKKIEIAKNPGKIDEIVEKYGVPRRSVIRWKKIYKEEGINGFLKRKNRDNTEWSEEAKDFFLGLYLSENRRDVMFCYRMMKRIGKEKGWRFPSYHTVYRFIENLPDYQKKLREGKKRIEDDVFPYIERDYSKMRPGEWWVSDHHQFDVAVKHNNRIIFPWVTVWYDMKARKVLSFIFVEKPNMNSINITLREAIRKYGKPENILIDNGKDYKAKIFQGGEQKIKIFSEEEVIKIKGIYENLNIKPHFAIPYNAKSKPVERWFRTLEGQFGKMFPGYRGSNTRERPEKLIEEMKRGDIFSLNEMQKLMEQYVEEYNNEERKILSGKSANEVFNSVNLPKVDEKALLLLTLKWKRALKMKRNGLLFLEHWYRSDNFYEYIGKYVVPKYDPFDVSKIYIFDTEGRFLFEMERVGRGASLEDEIKEITRVKRRIRNSYKKNRILVKKSQEAMQGWILERAGIKREKELIKIEKIRDEEEETNLSSIGEQFLESLSLQARRKEIEEDKIFDYI